MSKQKFNTTTHRTLMIKILKEIYSDTMLQTSLGFKGVTALYLFYKLPRFSIDLDFDLINKNHITAPNSLTLTQKNTTHVLDQHEYQKHNKQSEQEKIIINKIKKIISKLHLKPNFENKRFTLFFLLNYQLGTKNIKIEISKRKTHSQFEVKNYLGIPMLVMTKENMLACKLSALLTRKKFASRDVFDLWFMLNSNWTINELTLKEKTGFTIKEALDLAMKKIKNIKKNQLLQGLGELLNEKTKFFVKEKLTSELLFLLKLQLKD